MLARVPFDEGSLTGKLREDTKFPDGDFRSQYFGGGLLEETVRRVEALRPIVEGAATSMARGALRYILSQPGGLDGDPGHAHAAPGRREHRRQRRRPAARPRSSPSSTPTAGSRPTDLNDLFVRSTVT